MSWLRIEGRMPHHRKVAPRSDAAWRLHVTAKCWCIEEKSDGEVPAAIPATLPAAPRRKTLTKILDELVDAGLWERTDDGFIIHDFLDYNPSAAESEARRQAAVIAGAAGGRAKANGRHGKTVAPALATRQQTASDEPSDTLATGQLDAKQKPSKPLPTRVGSDPIPIPIPIPKTAAAVSEQQQPGGRIRCPVPVTVSDDTLTMLHGNVGLAPEISRPWLLRWAIKQNAAESDLRTLEAWLKSAVAAVTGEWSKDKAAMRALVADNPEVDVEAERAERKRKRDEAERAAGEAKRRETAEAAKKAGGT